MENTTGFIVEVRAKGECPAPYKYGKDHRSLLPDEVFIGYFWQTMGGDSSDSKKAYIRETKLVDSKEKLFVYGEEAIFDCDRVSIKIHALRGPESNNRYLPAEYLQMYDTWNLQGN